MLTSGFQLAKCDEMCASDTTLVTFLMTLESTAQIREYCYAYLGSSSKVDAFCDAFVAQRDFVLGYDIKARGKKCG